MTVLKTGHIQIYMTDWMDWMDWIGSQTAMAARASLNRAVLTNPKGGTWQDCEYLSVTFPLLRVYSRHNYLRMSFSE